MKLRKLKIKDSLEMLEWISDPHINHYFKFSNNNYGITHVEKFIRDSWIDKRNIHLAIVNDFDEYMGTVSLKNIDNNNDNAEYSISLRKSAIGTDLAKKSTDSILYVAFYILNLNKIFFNVLNRNTRAVKFYKKYGFQHEGTFVKHIKLNGIYQNLELYGLFKSQYSEMKLCSSIEEIPIMLDKSIYEIGFFYKNINTELIHLKGELEMNKISDKATIYDGVVIGDNVVVKDYAVIYPGTIIEDDVEIMEGAVIGRIPKGAKATARRTVDEYKTVIIGAGTVISPHAVIYTDVQIGKGTLIGDGASIREQCRIGNQCIISRLVTVNYNTIIGDKTKIMDNTHITGNMRIGNNVFISVLVSTTNDNNIGSKGYSEELIKGPIIEDNVLVGAGANILPRVRIGQGSIVGAGALVTKDVPSGKVVMGQPAKIIRDVDK